MNSSKDHKNWLTVGEIVRLIKEPVALYTSKIIKEWHAKLPCLLLLPCTTPVVCQTKQNPHNLCPTCKGWYDELAKSHQNNNKRKIKWRENCNTSKWPNDPWEVAKFFMPVLGKNKTTVIDAHSTDLSSLLNVLEWTKGAVFAPDRRIDRNLVTQLREVRNSWAHAPGQTLPDPFLNDAFDIANMFVTDLDIVFSRNEVKKCEECIKDLQADGISNVTENELKILNLLRVELGGDVSKMKEELKSLKDDQSSDRQVIKKLVEKLENFETEYKSSQDAVNVQGTDGRFQLRSRIPDKPQIFIGRDIEVKEIISTLVKNDGGIVCIVGGPGYGKSTVAVEVSHNLAKNHGFVVIFSYLRNASTLSDVILRLCQDVGVNSGENPKSSLLLWLRSINEKKVVLVMDNIEQLLESNVKPEFTELVLTLRKNSQQYLQIVATTRTEFRIADQQTIANYRLKELDERFSIELLRKCCPSYEIKDKYLSELAKLCGFVPLALCIAGTIIPDLDDPSELIQWLRETPMEALSNPDQCVQQAIDFSFQKLSDEDKKAFVSLSVFKGNFQRNSAKVIIKKSELQTRNFLESLVRRSLVQKTDDKRFVIHLLIRRFLADHDQFQEEKVMAQDLMVKHFLEVCNSLTMNCYKLNGFSDAREQLKKDIHNVKETLKICSQDRATNPNILQVLSSSDVYKVSLRFFYSFSWDLLPVTVFRNFFESCMKLAESQNRPGIEILSQCQVANLEGRKSSWKGQEYIDRMEAIKAAFHKNIAVLKKNRSSLVFCYNFIARYDCKKGKSEPAFEFLEDDLPPLPDSKEASTIQKIDEVYILKDRGDLNKRRGNNFKRSDKEKYDEYMTKAKLLYHEALSGAKKLLGEHELTCILNKLLGDLFLNLHDNEEALRYYSDAANMRVTLQLDCNEAFVFLLKNYGTCLYYLRRFNESVKKLEEARNIADKLAEKNTQSRAMVYFQLAKTCSLWKPNCQEAARYAKTAMEMQELLRWCEVNKLEKIIEKAGENVAQ